MSFDRYPPPPPPVPLLVAHSGIGIASFVLGVIALFCLFGVVITAGVLQTSTPGGVPEDSPLSFVVGSLVLLFMLLALLALCLGIAGLVQRNRRKLFAVLGLALSVLSLVSTAGLIFLGLATG